MVVFRFCTLETVFLHGATSDAWDPQTRPEAQAYHLQAEELVEKLVAIVKDKGGASAATLEEAAISEILRDCRLVSWVRAFAMHFRSRSLGAGPLAESLSLPGSDLARVAAVRVIVLRTAWLW